MIGINPLTTSQRIINKIIKTYLIVKSHLHQPSFKQQEKILFDLIKKCRHTVFWKKYGFEYIKTIKDFQEAVPIFHYKDMEPWIMYMLKWEKDITYPGKIDRFATSSWTTWWESKYIPITKEWLKKSHFKWWADVLHYFCKNNPRSQFLMGKWLVVWGGFSTNPYTGEANIGFISAILQKNTPKIIKMLKEPSDDIAYIDSREEKVHAIVERTVHKDITFINGQPGWLLNLLYKVLEHTGKKNILEVRPNLELFFWWWLPITMYKSQFEKLIPSSQMKYYQIYNASEGFFGVQDRNDVDDMLLLVNHGTVYEFIPIEEYGKEHPHIITLEEVEIHKEYIIVITTCSWLRRYVIGDIVIFTELAPWRIRVAGRTKYFIDMIGERLSLDHIEKALLQTTKKTNTIVTDYTVWPLVFEWWKIRWCHEWVIEFVKAPDNKEQFAKILDTELGNVNAYYFDERHDTKVLGAPILHCAEQGTFYQRLKSKNKLGGQHKVPKVSNERKNIDEIIKIMTK